MTEGVRPDSGDGLRLFPIWHCPFPGCGRFVQIGAHPRLTFTASVTFNGEPWKLFAIDDVLLPAVGICPACSVEFAPQIAALEATCRRMARND